MTVISGAVILGMALCSVSNFLANRAADAERARRMACDAERESEMRAQASGSQDRLLALNRQLTRQ